MHQQIRKILIIVIAIIFFIINLQGFIVTIKLINRTAIDVKTHRIFVLMWSTLNILLLFGLIFILIHNNILTIPQIVFIFFMILVLILMIATVAYAMDLVKKQQFSLVNVQTITSLEASISLFIVPSFAGLGYIWKEI